MSDVTQQKTKRVQRNLRLSYKNMTISRQIFAKRSLFSLLVANLVVFVPFVLWMGMVQFFEPEYVRDVPPRFSFPAVGFLTGLLLAITGTAFIAIPSLYSLMKRQKSKVDEYWKESMFWLFILCLCLGAFAGLPTMNFMLVFGGAWVSFLLFLLPVSLCVLTYWYLAVRQSRNLKVLAGIAGLFLLWNYSCLQLVGVMAA